jgi:hypothetical protein
MPGFMPGIHVFNDMAVFKTWMAGHSRSKNGVALLAYVPAMTIDM